MGLSGRHPALRYILSSAAVAVVLFWLWRPNDLPGEVVTTAFGTAFGWWMLRRHAQGKDLIPPSFMVTLGVGALVVYSIFMLVAGLPTGGLEWLTWTFVLALPVLCLVSGIRRLRRGVPWGGAVRV